MASLSMNTKDLFMLWPFMTNPQPSTTSQCHNEKQRLMPRFWCQGGNHIQHQRQEANKKDGGQTVSRDRCEGMLLMPMQGCDVDITFNV